MVSVPVAWDEIVWPLVGIWVKMMGSVRVSVARARLELLMIDPDRDSDPLEISREPLHKRGVGAGMGNENMGSDGLIGHGYQTGATSSAGSLVRGLTFEPSAFIT